MGKTRTDGWKDLRDTIQKSKWFLLALFFSCFLTFSSSAQVPVEKFNFISNLLSKNNDTTYVINFWATWCKPCVKELPYFEKLKEKHKNEKLSITLVSLDYKRNVESHVKPFVQKNNLKNKVVLLDETNYNSWIDMVDSSWSGSIPATLIRQGKVKKLFEQEFTSYLELENSVKPFVK